MTIVRDPVCGMDVDTETALKAKIGDRTYYFCSQQCLDVYTAPERELKAMQRRVAFTLAGAIAALGLKVITLFGLIATIMYFEVVGGLRIYDIAIFIVSTPIVWIAGYRIYKGAYQSLRNRNINMDVLVTVGVLAGWIYGVLNIFVLPTVEAGTGYMEVAIGILAFVLLGRYIEELIRRRSAASIRKLLELQPTMARVVRDGKEIDMPSRRSSSFKCSCTKIRRPHCEILCSDNIHSCNYLFQFLVILLPCLPQLASITELLKRFFGLAFCSFNFLPMCFRNSNSNSNPCRCRERRGIRRFTPQR